MNKDIGAYKDDNKAPDAASTSVKKTKVWRYVFHNDKTQVEAKDEGLIEEKAAKKEVQNFIRASSDENTDIGVYKRANEEPNAASNALELHIKTFSEGITVAKDTGKGRSCVG